MLKILVFKSKESNVCQLSHKYTFMKIYIYCSDKKVDFKKCGNCYF